MPNDVKPIPAFYCCYLLRSTKIRSALYIGSTPNPLRRLAQHNGDAKGGAVRTAPTNLHPWEMTCIVAGFPSNIAALQFEWAWQNSHLTKRIAEDQRISARKTKASVSSKTGRTRRRPIRPRLSLTDHLSNLHLLLRVSSFERWPLELRFFCKDVYDLWVRWSERVQGKINSSIKILLDFKQLEESPKTEDAPPSAQVKSSRKSRTLGKGGIDSLDTGYSKVKEDLEKSLSLLAAGESHACAVCTKDIEAHVTAVLVCHHEDCRSVFHMSCLALRFLDAENQDGQILPKVGTCPQCGSVLQWIELVKELSLRTRGGNTMAKLMKKQRPGQSKHSKPLKKLSPKVVEEVESEDDTDQEQRSVDNDMDALNCLDEPLPDDWCHEKDEDDGASTSVLSDPSDSDIPNPERSKAREHSTKTVINDSDWDDAEILD